MQNDIKNTLCEPRFQGFTDGGESGGVSFTDRGGSRGVGFHRWKGVRRDRGHHASRFTEPIVNFK